VDAGWFDKALGPKWILLKDVRSKVTEAIEPMRRSKEIGSSLEATVILSIEGAEVRSAVSSVDFAELCICAELVTRSFTGVRSIGPLGRVAVEVTPTAHAKCARCWRHRPEVGTLPDLHLCDRCLAVVEQSQPGTTPAPFGDTSPAHAGERGALSSPLPLAGEVAAQPTEGGRAAPAIEVAR